MYPHNTFDSSEDFWKQISKMEFFRKEHNIRDLMLNITTNPLLNVKAAHIALYLGKISDQKSFN